MRTTHIAYDALTQKYTFTCPFCGKVSSVPDSFTCEHPVFAYEEVNDRPLFISDTYYNWAEDLLMTKRITFLESFGETFEDFRPQDTRKEDPDAWDDAKQEAIEYFLSERISVDDFLKMLRCSEKKDLLKKVVLALSDEDQECGKTIVVLLG